MSDDNTEVHYVARVVVERVTKTVLGSAGPMRQLSTEGGKKLDRTVEEVSSFTVKAALINSLKEQLKAHVELVQDYE